MLKVGLDGLFAPALERGAARNALGSLQPRLESAHAELMARRVALELGFYDLPNQQGGIAAVQGEASRLRALSHHLIVLGIGGSALGAQCLLQALPGEAGYSVHVADNVDPDSLSALLAKLDPRDTAVAVITKSGATVETLAQLAIVKAWSEQSVGVEASRSRFVYVTDPTRGFLRQLVAEHRVSSLPVPPNVGGRFSVLSAVGLLPAAFVGIDIDALCKGAAQMARACTEESWPNNPAMLFGAAALFALEQGKTQLVMMPYADRLRTFSNWFVQLWAESLGKRLDRKGHVVRVGQTPIAAVGAADQHAQLQLFVEGPADKLVCLVEVESWSSRLPIPQSLGPSADVAFLYGHDLGDLLRAERRATRAALLAAGVPVVDIRIPSVDSDHLGQLLLCCEAACALVGIVMGIDPFDQPGVEAGKQMAFGLLGRAEYSQAADRVKEREVLGTLVS